MRVDKWLKVSRLIKRRETAKQLCDDGDVFINGKPAKAMSEIHAGDTLLLIMGKHRITAKVILVKPFAKKEEAKEMFEILTDEISSESGTTLN
jgi:ribosomal 50S subunit-recycling heat shock protein